MAEKSSSLFSCQPGNGHTNLHKQRQIIMSARTFILTPINHYVICINMVCVRDVRVSLL